MTNIELLARVEEGIRNLDIDELLNIPTHEISAALTEAERVFVEQYYQVYETSEKARKALSSLVKHQLITAKTPAPNYRNGTFWAIPSDCKYLVSESAFIDRTPCGDRLLNEVGIEVPVKPVRVDYYTANTNNPFKKPYYELVWRLDVSDTVPNIRHLLISPDSTNILSYRVTYLSTPTGIDIENSPSGVSKINPTFHMELVPLAIQILINNHKSNVLLKQLTINQLNSKENE